MNLLDAAELLGLYLDTNIPAFLWGPPGAGKSDMVRQVAEERMMPVIDFRAILRDPVDLRGLPAVHNGVARWLPPSDLPDAARDGEEGILFLDELNAAPASVQAACFGLVLDRKVGEYHLPPGWRIIAAGNRQSDRAAAQRMPTALANRFAHIDVEVDPDAFGRWAVLNELHPMVLAFLRWRPALLHNMEGSDLRAFPTPRSWARTSAVAGCAEHLLYPAVSGLVGEGAAAEFMGFVRVYRDLPSLDLVLANPGKAPLPKEPSGRFAITVGLARKVDANSFGAGMEYVLRMNAGELEIMYGVDAVRRDTGLSHTQAFTDWAVRNQDVTIR